MPGFFPWPKVGPAAKSFPVGVWSDCTPQPLSFLPYDHSASFGIDWVEVSPVDNNVIYCCVDQRGLWRSPDGGFTWALVGGTIDPPNEGTTTTYFDSPISILVDPSNANHMYLSQGVRGHTLGFWRTTDGINWSIPSGFDTVATDLGSRDVTQMSVEQGDFNHILLSCHQGWPGFTGTGYLESTDGGTTWTKHNPRAEWAGGTLGLMILHDLPSGQGNSSTWLVGSDGSGMWRTTDSGANYTQVTTFSPLHGGNVGYYDPTGRLWMGAANFPVYSDDNGLTWTQPSTGLSGVPGYYNVCSDGVTLYASPSFTGDNSTLVPKAFFTSPVSDGNTWAAQANGQVYTCGPYNMKYAKSTRRVYASCWAAGLRVFQL